jgi:hypothetical protein
MDGWHVPHVDNVVTKAAPPPAEDPLASTLGFLDQLEGVEAMPAAPPAPQEPAPTRLKQIDTAHPARPAGGRHGPDPAAVAAVRAAAKARLARRAEEKRATPGEGSQLSRSPRAPEGTTVSQSTLDQYMRRGNLLFERYRRERGIPSGSDVAMSDWVSWLLALKPGLKSATWRMYRQAAYHFLEGVPDAEDALAALDADVIDRSREAQPSAAERGLDRQTSALKEKRFPVEDFNKVCTYLRAFNRSKIAPVLLDWLRAGVLTALRPIEWRAADLEIVEDRAAPRGRRVYLYVLNAKATNERGSGVVRTLDITNFSDVDVAVVQRMVDRGRQWLEKGVYADMQGRCQALLYQATKKLWERRRYAYALYSCRHQAIANWKAHQDFFDKTENLSAIIGHGVTATAAAHYGKRRNAWPPEDVPPPPMAVQEEAARVRKTIVAFKDRHKLRQDAGLAPEGPIPEYPIN